MEKLPLSLRRRVSLDNVETLLDRFLQFGNFVNDTSNYTDFVTELIADLTDRIVVESGVLFSLSDDDYRALNAYLFDRYEPYLAQYYKNAMKDKGLQEEVQRIKEVMGVITEDLDKSVIRRIDFAKMNELVYYFMSKRIDYSGVHTIETMVYSVARTVAHELLDEKELRKFDNQQVFDELVKFIMDIYGKELKDYLVDKIVKHKEDLEKQIRYIFVVHDKPYYDKWRGFSEGFSSYVSLVDKHGIHLKGVDWDEVKSKLDNINYYPEPTFTGFYDSRPISILSRDEGNNVSIVKRVPKELIKK